MKKGFLLIMLCCLALTISAKTLQNDTINATICENDTYEWEGDSYDKSGDYTRTYVAVDGSDSVVTLRLTVLPIAYTTIDTTSIEGETYMWNGVAYNASGTYIDTLQKADGCDSILTLNLNVLANSVVINGIQTADICTDNAIVEILIDWKGLVDSVGLYFVVDTLDSIVTGLHDVIVPMPIDGHLSIRYSNVRAGVYKANLVGYFYQNEVFRENISLTFLYPSSVLEQRWDDVICVLAGGYNGGYDFTAFQWYKNGLPLDGEIGYYLSQPLEDGAEYSALLTEVDGTQLMTCPLVVDIKAPEVSVEPTLVTKRQPVRCQVTEKANLYVYDAMGKVQISSTLLEGETFVHLPQQAGIYMLKVVMHTGVEKCFKVLVM